MFPFTLATVDKILYEGEVSSVVAPGAGGELTVLANHMAFITTLKKGTVKIRKEKDGEAVEIEINGGLLEASSNNATILV